MMSRPGSKGVRARRPDTCALRPDHDRRALVVRLIRGAGRVTRRALAPDLLELGLVGERVVPLEKLGIARDSACDHLEAGVLEYRLALFAVGIEQVVTAPSIEHGSEFPAEVGDVFDTGVEAKATVGRVAVARVAGDETAAAS